MKVFLAVVLDLLDFAKKLFFRSSTIVDQESKYLPQPTLQSFLPAPQLVPRDEPVPPVLAYTEGYVSVPRARVFVRPVWVVDSVLAELALGKKVSLLSFEGRFVRVQTAAVEGWVLKDEIAQAKTMVWPTFNANETYDAKQAEVLKLRALIADEFFTSELYIPLQPTEYVSYRLRQTGRLINWSAKRPRPVGLWHELLKGQSGVFISLEPKTGAIVEYLESDDLWCLGYVESVMVDESVVITIVGRKQEGVFEKLTLNKPEWQMLRPVFIQIA